MAGWSPEIANEFIRLGERDGVAFTHMQLQKLVYIAHGWNLAVNGASLTKDAPQAWEFGPVYREIWEALRGCGQTPVTRLIANGDFALGSFAERVDDPAKASLSKVESDVVKKVYEDYRHFHAYQLSALTHAEGTPWTVVYDNGNGKSAQISSDLIEKYFVNLARTRREKAPA